MAELLKFMVVHKDPNISWEQVEENWRKLANVESATWVRTCFNKKEGVRYCIWLAPDDVTLKNVFSDLHVTWVSMLEVEETTPDLWGKKKWEEHLAAEATADTKGF